jgi:hypothetical protein
MRLSFPTGVVLAIGSDSVSFIPLLQGTLKDWLSAVVPQFR